MKTFYKEYNSKGHHKARQTKRSCNLLLAQISVTLGTLRYVKIYCYSTVVHWQRMTTRSLRRVMTDTEWTEEREEEEQQQELRQMIAIVEREDNGSYLTCRCCRTTCWRDDGPRRSSVLPPTSRSHRSPSSWSTRRHRWWSPASLPGSRESPTVHSSVIIKSLQYLHHQRIIIIKRQVLIQCCIQSSGLS